MGELYPICRQGRGEICGFEEEVVSGRYSVGQYSVGQYSVGQYSVGQYSVDQYSVDQYSVLTHWPTDLLTH